MKKYKKILLFLIVLSMSSWSGISQVHAVPTLDITVAPDLFTSDTEHWCNLTKYKSPTYGTTSNPKTKGCEYYKNANTNITGVNEDLLKGMSVSLVNDVAMNGNLVIEIGSCKGTFSFGSTGRVINYNDPAISNSLIKTLKKESTTNNYNLTITRLDDCLVEGKNYLQITSNISGVQGINYNTENRYIKIDNSTPLLKITGDLGSTETTSPNNCFIDGATTNDTNWKNYTLEGNIQSGDPFGENNSASCGCTGADCPGSLCGTAGGTTTSTQPNSTTLCSSGANASRSDSSGEDGVYNWTCTKNGFTESCSAKREVECGIAADTTYSTPTLSENTGLQYCKVSAPSTLDITDNTGTDGDFNWICKSGDGRTKECSAGKGDIKCADILTFKIGDSSDADFSHTYANKIYSYNYYKEKDIDSFTLYRYQNYIDHDIETSWDKPYNDNWHGSTYDGLNWYDGMPTRTNADQGLFSGAGLCNSPIGPLVGKGYNYERGYKKDGEYYIDCIKGGTHYQIAADPSGGTVRWWNNMVSGGLASYCDALIKDVTSGVSYYDSRVIYDDNNDGTCDGSDSYCQVECDLLGPNGGINNGWRVLVVKDKLGGGGGNCNSWSVSMTDITNKIVENKLHGIDANYGFFDGAYCAKDWIGIRFASSICQTIDGECGNAVNEPSHDVPDKNLCSNGILTFPTKQGGKWNWKCKGIGGSDATCETDIITGEDGKCDSNADILPDPNDGNKIKIFNACLHGDFQSISNIVGGDILWRCLGIGTGKDDLCKIESNADAKCNASANYKIEDNKYVLYDGCAPGKVLSLQRTSSIMTWNCEGFGTGDDDNNCSLNINEDASCNASAYYDKNIVGGKPYFKLHEGCAPGEVLDLTFYPNNNNPQEMRWNCGGLGTGADDNNCSIGINENASCNASACYKYNNSKYTLYEGCAPGQTVDLTLYPNSINPTEMRWNCGGLGSGTPDNNCSVSLNSSNLCK